MGGVKVKNCDEKRMITVRITGHKKSIAFEVLGVLGKKISKQYCIMSSL